MQSLVLAGNQGNQSGTDTTSILGDTNADLLLSGNSNLGNLTQGLAEVSIEVGVELDQTAVDTHINNLLGVQLAGVKEDSSKRDSAETGGALANGVDKNLDSLALDIAGVLDLQVILESGLDINVILGSVGLNLAQETGIQTPLAVKERVRWQGNLGGLAGLEDTQLRVIVNSKQGTAENFTQEHAGDTLFKHLDTGVVALGIEIAVVNGVGEHAELVVEATPFSVDDHLTSGLVEVSILHVVQLGDSVELLNVGTIGTGTKDGAQESASLAGGSVGAGHQSTDGVIDQGGDTDGEFQIINGGLEQSANIMADGIGDVEALSPTDQGSGVDTKLAHGETESETQIEQVLLIVTITTTAQVSLEVLVVMDAQERFDLAGEEEEEVLGSSGGHEFAGDHDLGLSEGEGGIAM